jgi:ribosomal protein S25
MTQIDVLDELKKKVNDFKSIKSENLTNYSNLMNSSIKNLEKDFLEFCELIKSQKQKEDSDISTITPLINRIESNDKELKEIVFINNSITEEQLKAILKSLENNTTVINLDFRNNLGLILLINKKILKDLSHQSCVLY